MDYLPIFLDLRGRKGLVVGGGDAAARKATLMLSAGAWVTAVSPEPLSDAFKDLIGTDRLIHLQAAFRPEHLDGADVVFAASGDDALDQAVHDAARARHVPVNVVDRPGKCSFIMPSIIDRSPVMVAVSSGGEAPVLSRLLRARLETLIPAAYGRLAALAGRFKQEVRGRFTTTEARRKFWEKTFLSPSRKWCSRAASWRRKPSSRPCWKPRAPRRTPARSTWSGPGRATPICSPSAPCG
jgi:uroporphyrin-III C-methyltransferase/precorrin-2 dehydrogenase/sirohydrochlorin ferrochelatase